MNVLFLTHARLDKLVYGDASTRYRCFNMAEVLQNSGHRASVQSLSELTLSDVLHYDVVSCLRPASSRKLQHLSSLCRSRGIHFLADFDDLIFDPDMAEQSPLVVNAFAPASQVRSQFNKHAKALSLFDEFTVSTPALREALSNNLNSKLRNRQSNSLNSSSPEVRVTVIRNGLSAYWLQYAEHACQLPAERPRLSYLPGSRSHDRDLQMIAPALSCSLKHNPEARLSLVGKIGELESGLPQDQLEFTPWIDYFSLPELIAQSSATLAPLLSNPFSYAKSHIKFIESAALGVPVVCSPTSDLIEHEIDGLNVIDHPSKWQSALDSVLCPNYRPDHHQALIDYALQRCTAQHYCQPVFNAWNSDSHWANSRTASAA